MEAQLQICTQIRGCGSGAANLPVGTKIKVAGQQVAVTHRVKTMPQGEAFLRLVTSHNTRATGRYFEKQASRALSIRSAKARFK